MTASLLCAALALAAADALAQEQQHLSFKAGAETSKYTQQTMIDVGDVSGHQIRVYEVHRTFAANAPVINGMKMTEIWTRGASDLIDGTGNSVTYGVYVMENGDKFFSRAVLVAQKVGPGKYTTMAAGTITSGTGKLAGIRGIIRTSGFAEPKAGVTETTYEFDYSME